MSSAKPVGTIRNNVYLCSASVLFNLIFFSVTIFITSFFFCLTHSSKRFMHIYISTVELYFEERLKFRFWNIYEVNESHYSRAPAIYCIISCYSVDVLSIYRSIERISSRNSSGEFLTWQELNSRLKCSCQLIELSFALSRMLQFFCAL